MVRQVILSPKGAPQMTVVSAPTKGKAARKVRGRAELVPIGSAASPVERVPRKKLKASVELGLVARSAGRCEFRGCNRYLYAHPLTGDPGNFAENAHIVAFREAGPRGRDGVRPANIDSVENLMLLCAPCHHLVDITPAKYPRAVLDAHKREHEARIKRVTALGPAMQTTVLQVKCKIGESVAEVSLVEAAQALMPRYPAGDPQIVDLTGLGDEKSQAFYDFAAGRIRQEVQRLYATGGALELSKHLSVFALAPIPLLTLLGHTLSNKVQTDFFQCHRDRPDRWTWYEDGPAASFGLQKKRAGTSVERIALVLSLSGTVDVSTLPAAIDDTFSVYEIALASAAPNPGFLRQREDLEAFRLQYRNFLALVTRDQPLADAVHVFPAIPAPVAVACGFDLLPKVHPALLVYDNDRRNGGFVQRLKVNDHDR